MPPAISQTHKIRRPFFYRDKRVLLSLLVSIPCAYFFGFFPAIFMHLQIGVLVDGWYFQYKNVKESEVASEAWLSRVGLTKEQLDEHSTIFIWQRYIIFLLSFMASAVAVFFELAINYEAAFFSAFFASRFLAILYAGTKSLIYPWFFPKQQMGVRSVGTPLWGNSNDLMNPLNTLGFNHPASPYYKAINRGR